MPILNLQTPSGNFKLEVPEGASEQMILEKAQAAKAMIMQQQGAQSAPAAAPTEPQEQPLTAFNPQESLVDKATQALLSSDPTSRDMPSFNIAQTELEGIQKPTNMFVEAAQNLPGSLVSLGVDMARSVTVDAPETIKGLFGLGVGAFSKFADADLDQEKYVDQLVQDYVDKYGSWERIENTLRKDPAMLFSDIMGFTGLSLKAGSMAAKASRMNTIVDYLNEGAKFADMIDPAAASLNLTAKGIGAAGGAILDDIRQKAKVADDAQRLDPDFVQPQDIDMSKRSGSAMKKREAREAKQATAFARDIVRADEGSTKAAEKIIRESVKPDTEVVKAFERQNLTDQMLPDVISTDPKFKAATQLEKSQPMSELRFAEREALSEIGVKLKDTVERIGGTEDLSLINDEIKTTLKRDLMKQKAKESKAFEDIRKAIGTDTRGDVPNLKKYLDSRIDEVEGVENLQPIEKELYSKLVKGRDDLSETKIIDDSGAPLKVFHGTDADFENFDFDKIGDKSGNFGHFGFGTYFSKSRGEASTYGKNIKEAYVDIKNPFDADNPKNLEKYAEEFGDYQKEAIGIDQNWLSDSLKRNNPKAFVLFDSIKRLGYDEGWNEASKKVDLDNVNFDPNDVADLVEYSDPKNKVRIGDYTKKLSKSLTGEEPSFVMGFDLRDEPQLKYMTDLGDYTKSKEFSERLIEDGYDGVVSGSEVIVFDPSQIKQVDKSGLKESPKYTLIDEMRKKVGALSGKSKIFGDSQTASADQLYKVLSDDLNEIAGQKVGEGVRDAANKLSRERFATQNRLTELFGDSLNDSMITKLESGRRGLASGAYEKMADVLNAVPEEMRQEVAASAILKSFGNATKDGVMNYRSFSKWAEDFKKKTKSWEVMKDALGEDFMKTVDDMRIISKAISDTTTEKIYTGRALSEAFKKQEFLLDSLVDAVKKSAIGVPVEMATSAIGLPGYGLVSGLTAGLMKFDKKTATPLKNFANLSKAPEFRRMMVDLAKDGKVKPETITRLEKVNNFKTLMNQIGVKASERKQYITQLIKQAEAAQTEEE